MKKPLDITLSQSQYNEIIGHLLGDGTLSKVYGNKWNSSFDLSQCARRLEYIEHIYAQLQPLSSSISHGYTQKNMIGNYTLLPREYYRVKTIHHPVFTALEKQWYLRDINGQYIFNKNNRRIKIVPKNLVLNWSIVAYWFLDDGCNNDAAKAIFLHTNNFTVDEVHFLRNRLLLDLNINSTMYMKHKKYPIIRISSADYNKFLDETYKVVGYIKCFQYKFDFDQTKCQNLDNYTPRNLTQEQINYIIDVYEKRTHIMRDLSDQFGVSISVIQSIIRSPNTHPGYKPHHFSKLSKAHVLEIIDLWNSGIKQKEIAQKFSVCAGTIQTIVRKKSHSKLTKDIYSEDKQKKLTDEEVIQIRQLVLTHNIKQLMKMFRRRQETIEDAITGITYSHLPGAIAIKKLIKYTPDLIKKILEMSKAYRPVDIIKILQIPKSSYYTALKKYKKA